MEAEERRLVWQWKLKREDSGLVVEQGSIQCGGESLFTMSTQGKQNRGGRNKQQGGQEKDGTPLRLGPQDHNKPKAAEGQTNGALAATPPLDWAAGGQDKPVTMADLLQLMMLQEEGRRRQDEERRAQEDERRRQDDERRRQDEERRTQEDERRRQDEERRAQEDERHRQDDERRHQDLLQLQRERLNQEAALEKSRREAQSRQEEQRKRDKELERKLRETPPLPKMTEDADMEMFLADFEEHMADLEVPRERWLTSLRPLLSAWARGTVDILSDEDRRRYGTVKDTLLAAFASTKGTLGYRALTVERQKGQSAAQFLTGIHRRWKHWIGDLPMEEALVKVTMAVGELHLPYACKSYIQARKPATEQEMAASIEQFFAERGSSWDDPKWKTSKPFSSQWTGSSRRWENTTTRWRQQPLSQDTSSKEHTDQPSDAQETPTKPDSRVRERSLFARGECFNCGRKGHYAAKCPDKQVRINRIEAPNLITIPGIIGREECSMMLDSGAAMSLFPAKLVEQQCYTGQRMSVRGAVGERSLPTAVVPVEVDGKTEDMCVLVTSEDTTPLLGIDFPHFERILHRKLAERLARDEHNVSSQPQLLQVQTRRQQQVERQQLQEDDDASATSEATTVDLDLAALDSSLFGSSKVKQRLTRSQKRSQSHQRLANNFLPTLPNARRIRDFTPEELEAAQHADDDLLPLWRAAEAGQDGFHIAKGLLRHCSEDDWGDVCDQLVVPQEYRIEIIELAHGSKLSAHLGSTRTTKKILRDFYWPGVSKDVSAFCKSCEVCQRAANTAVSKAPLQPLPAIGEPFRRVAVDIVGPLQRTKNGNKYILTLMDFATRYPEAIPLRKIDAISVAEALCHIFTRLGLPQEILSDQGSNFMSDLMRQVAELLGIHQIKTSPYHPQTNGMLERFHATLKSMIRKSSSERTQWDLYLPYACFAFRDTTHSATGYTPFQLLFGRDVRGPLSLLYDQLTEPSTGTRPVVEYIDTLKTRLRDAWSEAAQNDSDAKARSKAFFDTKAKNRVFSVGDQVLVMSPTPTSKLADQWAGPYTIMEKMNAVTYRVHTPDRRKKSRLYHVNGIKLWNSPTVVMSVTVCEDSPPQDTLDPDVLPFEHPLEVAPTVGDKLTAVQQEELYQLVQEHHDLFDTSPGHTDVVEHKIVTGDSRPVYRPPYRLPSAWQGKVRTEVQEMLDAGIIEPSTSPWTSSVVPIPKKDGSLRLCVDYRSLNQVTQDDRYPMPRVEELLEQVGKASYITTLDLTKGYYQVSVCPCDREKTAFMAPMGKFQFTRMPFGLKGAPSTFQRLMDVILAPCSDYARSYIDDIVIFSSTWSDHMRHLRDVFQRLIKAGLKAKPSKCKLAMDHCTFLGHVVGRGLIAMEEAKVDALRNYKRPVTKRDVRAFLGLAGYYRRFVPGFAELTARISDLTKKEFPNQVNWTSLHERDFQKLKNLMCDHQVLHCPDNDQPFFLQTDASERGIGAVLSQVTAEGLEKPVAFFSRKLLPREARYSTVEKECLGVVAALKHFDAYLTGRNFTIVTDHKALQYLQTMRNANARLTRWALALQPFTFTVTHRPGRAHGNADGLSRQAWVNEQATDIPA